MCKKIMGKKHRPDLFSGGKKTPPHISHFKRLPTAKSWHATVPLFKKHLKHNDININGNIYL